MTNKVWLDTNVLLRHFLSDVKEQSKRAIGLLKKIEEGQVKGVVSLLVINEFIWIMEHYYEVERSEFVPMLLELLGLRGLKVEEVSKNELRIILENFLKSKIGLTDVYLARKARNEKVASFDNDLERLETDSWWK